MNDADLERLLREANPAGPAHARGLEARQRAVMENIIASAAKPRFASRLRARWPLVAIPLAATAVIALVLAFVNPLSVSPAVAYGPPPLSFESTDDSLEDIVTSAQQRLATVPAPLTAQQRSSSVSWSLTVDNSGEPEQASFISPLETELIWAEDLSGRRIVKSGEPYPVNEGVASEAVQPGTVLDDTTFAVGEYPALLPDAENLDEEYAQQMLAHYAPPSTRTPGDAMWAVADALNEWTFTNSQHAALLSALLAYDRIAVLGTTADRAGRSVIGIQGAASGGIANTLLVSAETGRIVGMETAVVGDDSALPVPVGTVTSYTLWKDTQ